MQKARTLLLLFFLVFCTELVSAQYAFAIFFSDKNGTPYSLSSPGDYLSARALHRRAVQSISVDSSDLPVSPRYLDSVVANCGGLIYETSKWLNLCVLMVYDSSAINALIGKPFVDSVVLVGIYDTLIYLKAPHKKELLSGSGAQRTTTDDGTYFNYTWVQTNQIQGNCLYDAGFNGSGKMIAVLDAGFIGANEATGFDSLWADSMVVDMHNFVYDTDYVFGWDVHGTNVLSTMAAYVPDTFVGAAPKAQYALYITEYDPNDQPLEMINMVCGSERADSVGADVITESLGYDLFSNPNDGLNFSADLDGKTTYAARAANWATKKGILFVATAGNDGGGWETWGDHITTPGDADSALTVGAVTTANVPASFSGYGPNAAGIVKPDVCALGQGTSIINYGGIGFSEYTWGNGTSFSTPIIAGWAACLLQAYPNATPAQIRNAINESASMYFAPTDQEGFGIPDFCTAMTLLGVAQPQAVSQSILQCSPDPFTTDLSVAITLNQPCEVTLQLTDVTGRILITMHKEAAAGSNEPTTIDGHDLAPGMYLINANGDHIHTSVKVVKK